VRRPAEPVTRLTFDAANGGPSRSLEDRQVNQMKPSRMLAAALAMTAMASGTRLRRFQSSATTGQQEIV